MMLQDSFEFADLVGKQFDFYGVDGHRFKLDDTVWEAVEDEADGYRSYLTSIKSVETEKDVFFRSPVARVQLEDLNDGYTEGFALVDTTARHVWLTVGTSNYDDYYPYFVFNYEPKKPVTV